MECFPISPAQHDLSMEKRSLLEAYFNEFDKRPLAN